MKFMVTFLKFLVYSILDLDFNKIYYNFSKFTAFYKDYINIQECISVLGVLRPIIKIKMGWHQ